MKHGELEELFERYRSAKDLDALGKLFDLAAPELLRLAVHIAPDLATAEDLVQQTFLAAIEKPARWRAGEPLLPWLFGILSNLAKKQRRSARRAPDADRLHSREPEDPASAVLSAETRRAAESALERIPELYREVVRASLFEDKSPHAIARDLDRAPGTVRMQLLRGLELLRRALPSGLAGGGALILCGTRGEAALKSVVLKQAAARTVVVAAGTSTLVLGGLIVSTKTVVAILAGLALCGWLLWPEPQSPDIAAADAKPSAVRDAPVPSEAQVPSAEGTANSMRSEVETAVEIPFGDTAPAAGDQGSSWWLVGRLLDVRSEHASEVELHVSRQGVPGDVTGHADAQGRFEIDLAALCKPRPRTTRFDGPGESIEIAIPGTASPESSFEFEIWSRHPRYISEREVIAATKSPSELAAGERREIRRDLRLRPASIISGRVRVPAGRRVEEVDVRVDPVEPSASNVSHFALEHSNCNADGTYWLKSIQSGEVLVYAVHPGLVPCAAHCAIAAGEVLELPELVLEESRCELEGRVDLPAAWLTESAGRGFGEMEVVATRVDPPSHPRSKGAEDGTLIDARNARSFQSLRGGYPLDTQTAKVESDGHFRLGALEPGRWELVIHGIDSHSLFPPYEKTVVDAPAGNLVIGSQLCRISAFVVDASGPVRDAIVTFDDGSNMQSIPAGAEGRVAVICDLRQAYTVNAHAPGRQPVVMELPIAGRQREDRVELRMQDAPPTARLILRAPPDHDAPKALQVHLRPAEERESAPPERNETVRLAGDRYVVENVFAGRWKLQVGPSEEQIVSFYGAYLLTERFEITLVAGQDREQLVRCEPGGRVRVTLDGAGAKGTAVACTLEHPDGRRSSPRIVSAESGEGFGVFRASDGTLVWGRQNALEECLAPGNYELRADENGESLAFEVKAGETTQLSWKLGQ